MKLSKSKLALAKVINENGGWPIGADWSFQPKHDYGDVWFSSGSKKPIRSGDGFNHGCVEGKWIYESIIQHKSMIDNWHQCVLSREEYHQAYPKADADWWIEWKGGECPVERGTLVDVKYAGGEENYGVSALTEGWHKDHVHGSNRKRTTSNWADGLPVSGIVSYRLHKPEVKPEFRESVTRSITEPEANEKLSPEAIEDAKVALMSESIEESKRKPTIEQLAQDYRNAKDYADRLQKEAAAARVKADAVMRELIDAGNKSGLTIRPHNSGGTIPSSVSYRVGEVGV